MKKILTFIFLFSTVCFSQIQFPHDDSLFVKSDSVYSDEVFTVTYTLQTVPGHYFIGVLQEPFVYAGSKDREIYLQLEEKKTVSFKVKLRDDIFKTHETDCFSLTVGFGHEPLGYFQRAIVKKSIKIRIIDAKEKIAKAAQEQLKDTLNTGNGKLKLKPYFHKTRLISPADSIHLQIPADSQKLE